MSRVLLCVSNAQLRQDLANRLASQHECLRLPAGSLEHLSFDVGVIDEPERRLHPELMHLRDDRGHRRPPFLLILPRETSLRDARELMHDVDDVIFTPVHPVELSARVERLLGPRGTRPEAREAAGTALRESEARLTETEVPKTEVGSRVMAPSTEDRWRALKEAVSAEMTELAVQDRPLHEFLERGATNYARLFPDLICVTVVDDEQSRSPSVITSANLPDDLRRALEEPRFHESLVQPASHSNGLMVVEDIEKDARCAHLPRGAHRTASGRVGSFRWFPCSSGRSVVSPCTRDASGSRETRSLP